MCDTKVEIDWTKPIEYRYNDKWCDAKLLHTYRDSLNYLYPVVILVVVNIDKEFVITLTEDGKSTPHSDKILVRNKKQEYVASGYIIIGFNTFTLRCHLPSLGIFPTEEAAFQYIINISKSSKDVLYAIRKIENKFMI
jgi:hypothetical protein